MIRNYIRVAWRNMKKNRLTTFINVFGLGLSMSVGLMIMIRVQDDFSYDKFHPHPDRTYRIISEYQKKGDVQWKMASTALPLSDALARDSNLVQDAVRVYPALSGKIITGEQEQFINGAFTDPAFFNIFGFELAAGDPATALQMPNSIVLSAATAERFFGTGYAVGRSIEMETGTRYQVTGVMKNAPGKSHLNFDAYASMATVPRLEKEKILPPRLQDQFAFNAGYTYLLVQPGTGAAAVQSDLNAIAAGMNAINKSGVAAFELQPLGSITPGSIELSNNTGGGTSWTKIWIEGGMSLLILLAACFNYTNLTIARSLVRAKEVGIRKIAGARRAQIFGQYIIESVVLSLFALAFAWLLLFFVVRFAPFNDDYEFIPSSFHYNAMYIGWSVLYGLFTGVVAGTSPAWILSSFTPLRVLKNLSTARIMGNIGLQKSLTVFQYSLSLVILIFLFSFYKQFSFMASADPGFKRHHVMVVPLQGIEPGVASHAIQKVQGVTSVGASSARFTKRFSGQQMPVWVNRKENKTMLNYYFADADFVQNLQFQFAAGSNFTTTHSNENEQYLILNEKAVQALGFSDDGEAIGKKVFLNDSVQLTISGVLKDFAYESAGRNIDPLAFRNKLSAAPYLYVSMEGKDKKKMEQDVLTALNDLHPVTPPIISWVADDLDSSNSQTATISLLGFLGFITLAIASLGLLGLVMYAVQVKGKEISIRKIIGATRVQLVQMLSKGFVKLLLVAGLIAVPVGWILSALFLRNFSNRTSFGWAHVTGCFLFLLAIGLLAILPQTYRAASANPAKKLRTE